PAGGGPEQGGGLELHHLDLVATTATQPAPVARRRGFAATYLAPKTAIPSRALAVLAVASFAVILGLWTLAALLVDNPFFVPTPLAVVQAWIDMLQHEGFLVDIGWSTFRIVGGFALAASRWTVLRKVFLPATLPEVVDALRITMGWAWTYLIVAELVAATAGIGYVILVSERFLRADRIIAAILTIGLLGLLTDQIF